MSQQVDFEVYKEKLTYVRSNIESLINHETVKNHSNKFEVERLIEDATVRLTKVVSKTMFFENILNLEEGDIDSFKQIIDFNKIYIDFEISQICGRLLQLQKKLMINFEYLRNILFKIENDMGRVINRYNRNLVR